VRVLRLVVAAVVVVEIALVVWMTSGMPGTG
jgi:hypothetical protein